MNPARRDRIYLSGFMGSGKSTIGPILGNTLGYDFADLDRTIEAEEGIAVSEIFRSRGEEYFRRRERELIIGFSVRPHLVVSLGGGTLNDPISFETVQSTGILVYLKLPPELLLKRLNNRTDRPMLMDADGNRLSEEQLRTRVQRLFLAREPIYEKADITIEADERRVGITVDRIVRALAPLLKEPYPRR
jgi:shikimate kinase